jgi:hypothetical protein
MTVSHEALQQERLAAIVARTFPRERDASHATFPRKRRGAVSEGATDDVAGVGESDGSFESWFITQGEDGAAVAPATIKVFLEVGPGRWHPVEVTAPVMRDVDGPRAVLDLGSVRVDEKGALRVGRTKDET